MARNAARNVVRSVRTVQFSTSSSNLALTNYSHAYEITQVARQNWDRNKHGRHFGTKVLAVHRRALEEIHVGAMDSDEVYGSYSYPPRRR